MKIFDKRTKQWKILNSIFIKTQKGLRHNYTPLLSHDLILDEECPNDSAAKNNKENQSITGTSWQTINLRKCFTNGLLNVLTTKQASGDLS